MIQRRSFLGAILAAAAAPAFVRAGVLMPVKEIWTPDVSLDIVQRVKSNLRRHVPVDFGGYVVFLHPDWMNDFAWRDGAFDYTEKQTGNTNDAECKTIVIDESTLGLGAYSPGIPLRF